MLVRIAKIRSLSTKILYPSRGDTEVSRRLSVTEISSERHRSREEKPGQPVEFRKGFLEAANLNGKWWEARSRVTQAEGRPCVKVWKWGSVQRTRDWLGRRMCRGKLGAVDRGQVPGSRVRLRGDTVAADCRGDSRIKGDKNKSRESH